VGLGVLLAAGRAGAQAPLVLGVHPYLSAAEIVERFTPIANAIGLALGRPVVVRVGRNYGEHVEAIGKGAIDLAYMGPAPYVRMVARYGQRPLLARQVVGGDPMLYGEIVVRQESDIQTLADLKGKRFAFGDPESTTSHVVPSAMLRAAGVPEQALGLAAFLDSHRNVALGVLAGDFDAGAVKEEIFIEYGPRGLRSIARQPPVVDHVFVASAALPAEAIDAVRRTLLDLSRTPEGRHVLEAIQPGLTALVPAQDSDYDNLRALMRVAAPAR
jgi:phosphonate transport system substrate-binding protein